MPIIITPANSFYGGSPSTAQGQSFSNANILRKLSADSSGNLTFDGKTVAHFPVEVSYSTILSQQDILRSFLSLPHDCDSSQSITLALQGISTVQGVDWVVDEKTAPELDIISWEGLGLEKVAHEGDSVIITYYKKS